MAWNHSFGRVLLLAATMLGTVLFGVSLIKAWITQTHTQVTCNGVVGETNALNYIRIELKRQYATEPVFEGSYFAYFRDFDGTESRVVEIVRSGGRGYLSSTRRAQLRYVQGRGEKGELMMNRFEDFDLITNGRTHRYFPFDSGVFDFQLSVTPHFKINLVRIINHVPGFIIDCSDVRSERTPDGKLHISFVLSRNPLIQLTAVVLGLAAAIFVILILQLKTVESVATSVASFFFSMWSIRGILGSELKTFPTLLDAWVLTLSVMLIVPLLWKVVLRRFD